MSKNRWLTLDSGRHLNAHAQRRGQSYHRHMTEPPRRKPPLAPRPLQRVVRP